MFYLATPGCREETSSPAVRMRHINFFLNGKHANHQTLSMQHVLATIWPQWNNFQQKSAMGFHKSVKHCKSFRCWEVEQVPNDLLESPFDSFLRQTLGLSASGLS